MPNKKRFVWPLVLGWVALAIVAVLWAVPNEEDDLTSDAEAALTQAGISATVDFEGRLGKKGGAEALETLRECGTLLLAADTDDPYAAWSILRHLAANREQVLMIGAPEPETARFRKR